MSKLMGTGVLALWIDVAPELDRETDHWYVDEHMPERIDIGGYNRARRYQAMHGSPRYLTLFEAETPAALASEGYLSLVSRISEQSKKIRAGFSNVVRNTFKVRASSGRGIGAVMASLRLEAVDPGQEASTSADMDGNLARLLHSPGIVGTHWLEAAPEVRQRMDAVRAVGQQDGIANHVLLIEATRSEDLQQLRDGLLSEQALREMGWKETAFGLYGLLYEVSRTATISETTLGDRI